MRISILLLFSLLVFRAYPQWTQIPSGTFSVLNDIKFVNDSSGYISGGCPAVLLKTTDYGLSWHAISGPAGGSYHDMCWLNQQTGFMCTDNILYKTLNGSTTWTMVKDFANETPEGVYFTSPSVGFAITSIYGPPGGSYIYKTTDGGVTWIKTNSFPNIPTLQDIEFTGADTGYVVGYFGNVIRTYDNGVTWTSANIPTCETIFAASFLNSTQGFVAGYSSGSGVEVAGSVNAGQNWSNFQTGGTMNYALRGLHFITAATGYACGDNGRLISTADGGGTWTIENSGVTTTLNATLFIPSNIGFAIGHGGVILRTQLPVGFSDGEFQSAHINIYPNPAHGFFVIGGEGEYEVSIYDAQGKLELGLKCKDKTAIDAGSLSPGAYVVKILSGSKVAVSKLIID